MHDETRPAEHPADLAATALRSVLLEHGRRVGQSPRQVRALLSDELGEHAHSARAYVDALVLAAEEGVPSDLMGATGSSPETIRTALATLCSDGGLAEPMAAFAVSTWAAALGVPTAQVTGVETDAAPVSEAPGTTVLGEPDAPASPQVAASSTTADETSRGSFSGPGSVATAAAANGADARSCDRPASAVASEPSRSAYVADRPERGRSRSRLVAACVGVAAVLALALVIWSGAKSVLGTGDGAGEAPHAGHAATPASTHTMDSKAQPPMQMPSATPVDTGVMEAVTATSGATQLAPTGTPVGTAPVAVDSERRTLSAERQSKTVDLQLTSSDEPGCAEVTGQKDLQWCELSFDVTARGNVKDWKIVDVALVEQHGKATVHGHSIHYQPFHNGAFVEHITYRLLGEGVRSGVGVITIHAACNTNYECH